MITDSSQHSLDLLLFIFAIFFPVVRIFLLVDLIRAKRHVPLGHATSALFLSIASAMAILVAAFDWIDVRNFEEKGSRVYGPQRLPYSVTSEPTKNHRAQAVIQVISLFFLKGAYLGLFWNAADGLSKTLRVCLYACTIYVFLSFLMALIPYVTWCASNASLPCSIFAIPPLSISFAAHISGDLLLFAMIVLILRTMHAQPRHEKVAVAVAFTIAGLSIFAACARYYAYRKVDEELAKTESTENQLHVTSSIIAQGSLWNKLELIFAISAYGVLFTRSLLRYCAERIRALSNRNKPRSRNDASIIRLEMARGVRENEELSTTSLRSTQPYGAYP